MKKSLLSLVLISAVAFVVVSTSTHAGDLEFAERFGSTQVIGESGTYSFDRAHTFIGFRIKHLGLIDVPGYFRDFTGTINYDAKEPAKSSVQFTAKMTSVDTGVAGRDNHLRTADFFEVEKYPEMTFKSTKVEKAGENWNVTGDLTMKGVTRSVSLPFQLTGFLPGNERQGMRMGVTAETIINRRDFDVTYGNDLPGGVPVIGNDVTVWLQIEALKQREEPAATQ
ncbi:MAG: YceI family protein [Blastocatellia bacterium]|nr:YceI family protein [Blastocatellia bacterium]